MYYKGGPSLKNINLCNKMGAHLSKASTYALQTGADLSFERWPPLFYISWCSWFFFWKKFEFFFDFFPSKSRNSKEFTKLTLKMNHEIARIANSEITKCGEPLYKNGLKSGWICISLPYGQKGGPSLGTTSMGHPIHQYSKTMKCHLNAKSESLT
jgi:hypothetical protein